MSIGRIIGAIAAAFLIALGLMFLIAFTVSQQVGVIVAGLVMIGIGIVVLLILFVWRKPTQVRITERTEVVQKVDLSGELTQEELKCNSCGAELDKRAVTVDPSGAVVISCPYCNSVYHLAEQPKW